MIIDDRLLMNVLALKTGVWTLQDLRMQLIAENGSVQRLDLPEDLKE